MYNLILRNTFNLVNRMINFVEARKKSPSSTYSIKNLILNKHKRKKVQVKIVYFSIFLFLLHFCLNLFHINK
jgi:hypothetical protein